MDDLGSLKKALPPAATSSDSTGISIMMSPFGQQVMNAYSNFTAQSVALTNETLRTENDQLQPMQQGLVQLKIFDDSDLIETIQLVDYSEKVTTTATVDTRAEVTTTDEYYVYAVQNENDKTFPHTRMSMLCFQLCGVFIRAHFYFHPPEVWITGSKICVRMHCMDNLILLEGTLENQQGTLASVQRMIDNHDIDWVTFTGPEVGLVNAQTGRPIEEETDNSLGGSVFKMSCVKIKKTAIQSLVELGKPGGEGGATDTAEEAWGTITDNGSGEFLCLVKANPSHEGLDSVLQEGAVLTDIKYRLQRTKDIMNSMVIYNPHKSGSNIVFQFQLNEGSLTLDRDIPRPVVDPETDLGDLEGVLTQWFHSMFRWVFRPSDSQQANVTLKDLACFQPKLGGIPLLDEEAAASPQIIFPVHGGIGGRQVGVHLNWGGSDSVFGVEAVFSFPSGTQNMLNDPTFSDRLERTLQQHSRWMWRREHLLPDDMMVQLCFVQIKSNPIRHILKLLGMDMDTLEDDLLRPLFASMMRRAATGLSFRG